MSPLYLPHSITTVVVCPSDPESYLCLQEIRLRAGLPKPDSSKGTGLQKCFVESSFEILVTKQFAIYSIYNAKRLRNG